MADIGFQGLAAIMVFAALGLVAFLATGITFVVSTVYKRRQARGFVLPYLILTLLALLLVLAIDYALEGNVLLWIDRYCIVLAAALFIAATLVGFYIRKNPPGGRKAS